jgi:uncharacterized protein YkwD
MMKKTFQILFLLLLAFLAYFLVDFSDLSLKTVEPDSKTEIQSLETAKTGIKKEQEKININEDNPTEKFFQGNGKEIIELTNKARKEEGAEPLKENSKLNASAMKKAEHMKDNNYFEHILPKKPDTDTRSSVKI